MNPYFFFTAFFLLPFYLQATEPLQPEIASDGWTLQSGTEQWTVDKPEPITVTAEKYEKLPMFNAQAAGFWKGRVLNGVKAEECAAAYAIVPESVKPDLMISEFVNDAWMHGEVLEQKYSKILSEFKEIGAEWSSLAAGNSPFYVDDK